MFCVFGSSRKCFDHVGDGKIGTSDCECCNAEKYRQRQYCKSSSPGHMIRLILLVGQGELRESVIFLGLALNCLHHCRYFLARVAHDDSVERIHWRLSLRRTGRSCKTTSREYAYSGLRGSILWMKLIRKCTSGRSCLIRFPRPIKNYMVNESGTSHETSGTPGKPVRGLTAPPESSSQPFRQGLPRLHSFFSAMGYGFHTRAHLRLLIRLL
jgi:hypothetical protein